MSVAPLTSPPAPASDAPVEEKLRAAWGKERNYHHVRGACHLLLWVVSLILVDLAVDWQFEAPGFARFVLLLSNLAILAWVAHRSWLRHLRRFDAVRVALQVEGRHPELENLLISYVQLRDEGDAAPDASPYLLGAMRRQAVDRMRPIEFRDFVNFGELGKVVAYAVVVVLFFAAISINWREHFQVLVLRMLNPFSSERYPTQTKIVDHTKDITIQQGKPFSITAATSGLAPLHRTLHLRTPGGTWQRLTMTIDGTDEPAHHFRYDFESETVLEDFDFYLRLDDDSTDRTKPYRVTVVPRPRLEAPTLRLTPPAYTGEEAEDVSTLSTDVLRNTRMQWVLRFQDPVSRVVLERKGGEAKELTLSNEGKTATSALHKADESFAYSFQWTHAKHKTFEYEEGVEHQIRVVEDQKPEVRIAHPASDGVATPLKLFTVKFRRTDDYGFSGTWLAYRIGDGNEQRTVIPELGQDDVGSIKSKPLREIIPQVKPGDVLTYSIVVADNYDGPDGPHESRSERRRLEIVSVEEYSRRVAETLTAIADELKILQGIEHDAKERIGLIRGGAQDKPPAGDGTKKP